MADDLLNHVRAKIREANGSLREIAEQSGVSESWLSKFGCGRINNPGYQRLIYLRDFFARRDQWLASQPKPPMTTTEPTSERAAA